MQSQHRVLIAAWLMAFGAPCAAQVPVRTAADSAFLRAQQLAGDGNAAAGRAVVDSVLAASPEGSPPYVDALYWRAVLGGSTDQARRDYLRIVVEFSLSPRAEDALLRLAQLELARGDRTSAKKHLEQLAIEHATGPSRAQGLLSLGRIQMDDGAMAEGCASLAEAKLRVPGADVELANQIDYYARPCAGLERAADAARKDSVARADSVVRAESVARSDSVLRADSMSKARVRTKNTARGATKEQPRKIAWSVQVAAFSSPSDAAGLAKRLRAQGLDARVTREKPFRVRLGRFARRDDAVQLAKRLKTARTAAIVVEAEQP